METTQMMLDAGSVCARYDMSKTTLWRWVKSGKFPAPRRRMDVGKRLWVKVEIDKWMLENCPQDTAKSKPAQNPRLTEKRAEAIAKSVAVRQEKAIAKTVALPAAPVAEESGEELD